MVHGLFDLSGSVRISTESFQLVFCDIADALSERRFSGLHTMLHLLRFFCRAHPGGANASICGQEILQSLAMGLKDCLVIRLDRKESHVEARRWIQLASFCRVAGDEISATRQLSLAINRPTDLNAENPQKDPDPESRFRVIKANAYGLVFREQAANESPEVARRALECQVFDVCEPRTALGDKAISHRIVEM